MKEQNKKYNTEIDSFSQVFKDKLYDHQTPVDSKCWDQIDRHLKSPRKRMYWWYGGSVAAIAIIILLLTIGDNKNETVNIATTISNIENISTTNNKNNKQTKEENTKNNSEQTEIIISKPLAKNNLSNINTKNKKSITDTKKKVYGKSSITSENQESRQAHTLLDEHNVAQLPEQESQSTNTLTDKTEQEPKHEVLLANLDDSDIFGATTQRTSRSKWNLAANIGMGSNMSSISTSGTSIRSSSNTGEFASTINDNTQKLSRDNYNDTEYDLPLSVGFMVRKNLSRHIALESGIMYTYLSTKFDNNGSGNKASLNLHYLGVPLNAVFYIWDNDKWNIYLTGGGMIEKGVRSVFNQNVYNKNGVISTSIKESIDGVQWSLNGSAGVGYRLNKEWGVYFEPRLSYYFDNEQPISIRTDKNIIFNLNAGLRYEF